MPSMTSGASVARLPPRGQLPAVAFAPQSFNNHPDRPHVVIRRGHGVRVFETEGRKMAKSPESATVNPTDNISARSSSGSQSKPEEARASSASPGSQPGTDRTVSTRKGQYLIAARRLQGMQPMGIQPLQFSLIEETLRSSQDIEVVDTVGPKSIMGVLADGMNDVPSVLVARMSEQKAVALHQQAQGRLIVERDQSLSLMDAYEPSLVLGTIPAAVPALSTLITVLGKDNAPLRDAEVYLLGTLQFATGVSDERGQVSMSLSGDTLQSIRGLYVKPKADHWSLYQPYPDLSADEANVVVLRPLSDWPSLANFPKQQVLGWGQKAMRLDQLPTNYRGQGIRVAVIDSGAATTHDDLRKIRFGFDVINKRTNPNSWNEDTIAHGSHSTGLIAGAERGSGMRGFAPDAELHVCKLFPGGLVSQLIDALEYCIEKQIDVVNLGLGGIQPSEVLEQQIMRARRAGVACIVAAGNSGGRVMYPASSPNVLTVSAIGKFNEFPPDSYHSHTITPYTDGNGLFSPSFTCYGPEVAVCGPGVAIASCVPPNNYAVWDGTSMAAEHVTGLAALVLAHHPDFQSAFKARSAERVDRLFQQIKLSARRVNVGDPSRTGFGLPDVPSAVGLQSQMGAPVTGYTADQMQFGSPVWFGGPWTEPNQFRGGSFSTMSSDLYTGAYATPFQAQPQRGTGMPGMAFGMHPSAFGRQGW
jgi:subtilisin